MLIRIVSLQCCYPSEKLYEIVSLCLLRRLDLTVRNACIREPLKGSFGLYCRTDSQSEDDMIDGWKTMRIKAVKVLACLPSAPGTYLSDILLVFLPKFEKRRVERFSC